MQHSPFPLSSRWILFSHGSFCGMPHASRLLCLCVFFVFGSSQQISEEASGVCLQPRFLGLLFFCILFLHCPSLVHIALRLFEFLNTMYGTRTSGMKNPLNSFRALGHFRPHAQKVLLTQCGGNPHTYPQIIRHPSLNTACAWLCLCVNK